VSAGKEIRFRQRDADGCDRDVYAPLRELRGHEREWWETPNWTGQPDCAYRVVLDK